MESIEHRLNRIERTLVEHQAALEAQDEIILETLRLACRVPEVQKIYLHFLNQLIDRLRKFEKAPSAAGAEKDRAIDASLAHLANFREAILNPHRIA